MGKDLYLIVLVRFVFLLLLLFSAFFTHYIMQTGPLVISVSLSRDEIDGFSAIYANANKTPIYAYPEKGPVPRIIILRPYHLQSYNGTALMHSQPNKWPKGLKDQTPVTSIHRSTQSYRMTMTTTKDKIMSANATNDMTMMVPRLAGNLPCRIHS